MAVSRPLYPLLMFPSVAEQDYDACGLLSLLVAFIEWPSLWVRKIRSSTR